LHNLDWFQRVYTNLEDELYEACELMQELIDTGNLTITSSEGEKHPTIKVNYSIEQLDYEAEPIIIYFDPYNQEFYSVLPDKEAEVRLMLPTLQDIVELIHLIIHENFSNILTSEEQEDSIFPESPAVRGNDLSDDDIEWLSDEMVTSEQSFDKPTKHTKVVSYRLGILKPMNQMILIRFETTYVNQQKVSKQGAMLPFTKNDVFVIQNLLNHSLFNH
jgi:hypothetical protein